MLISIQIAKISETRHCLLQSEVNSTIHFVNVDVNFQKQQLTYLITEDFAHNPDFIRLWPVGGTLGAAHIGPVASKLKQILARDDVAVSQQWSNVVLVIIINSVDLVFFLLLIELLGLGEGWGWRRVRRPGGRWGWWVLHWWLLFGDIVQGRQLVGDLVVVTVIQPDDTWSELL